MSYQSSELALLEQRLKQAEQLLEEKKQRLLKGGTGTAYEANPNFSSTPDADKKRKEESLKEEDENDNGAEPKDYVVVNRMQQQQYQMRPPQPPASVPAAI